MIAQGSTRVTRQHNGSDGKDGKNGIDGIDGKDAAAYSIVISPQHLALKGGFLQTETTVKATAYVNKGDETQIYKEGTINIAYTYIDPTLGDTERTENNEIDGYTTSIKIPTTRKIISCTADLSLNGTPLAQAQLQISEGGLFTYMAGSWNASTQYNNDGISAPIVEHHADGATTKQYFYLQTPGTCTAVEPTGSDGYWRKFNKFDALYTQILFADFAMLGSAIFYGDFMFSQTGRYFDFAQEEDNEFGYKLLESKEYQYFNKDAALLSDQELCNLGTDDDREENNRGFWSPNWCVNLLTGESKQAGNAIFCGAVKGAVIYTSLQYVAFDLTSQKTWQIYPKTDVVVVSGRRIQDTAAEIYLKLPDPDKYRGKKIEIYNWAYQTKTTESVYSHAVVKVIDDGAADDIYVTCTSTPYTTEAVSMGSYKKAVFVSAPWQNHSKYEWVLFDYEKI